jgi:hypothetical protein
MLIRAIEAYLAIRRAAGFALRCEVSLLKNFAAFSELRTQHYVSTDIAVEWAGLASSVPQRARRLGIVIRFFAPRMNVMSSHRLFSALRSRHDRPHTS